MESLFFLSGINVVLFFYFSWISSSVLIVLKLGRTLFETVWADWLKDGDENFVCGFGECLKDWGELYVMLVLSDARTEELLLM